MHHFRVIFVFYWHYRYGPQLGKRSEFPSSLQDQLEKARRSGTPNNGLWSYWKCTQTFAASMEKSRIIKHYNVFFINWRRDKKKKNDFLENIDFDLKRIFCDFRNEGYVSKSTCVQKSVERFRFELDVLLRYKITLTY